MTSQAQHARRNICKRNTLGRFSNGFAEDTVTADYFLYSFSGEPLPADYRFLKIAVSNDGVSFGYTVGENIFLLSLVETDGEVEIIKSIYVHRPQESVFRVAVGTVTDVVFRNYNNETHLRGQRMFPIP